MPLYLPLSEPGQTEPQEEIDRLVELQSWRVTQSDDRVPGHILGSMVHKAIQRWLFPGDPHLKDLLEMATFNAGLASEKLRHDAVDRAIELLVRLRQHPIWEEINSAQERYAELPYTFTVEGRTENRVIDLLYLNNNGWQILDFKTDPIIMVSHKEELVKKYGPQIRRYANVVRSKVGERVQARICFLDKQGKVDLVTV